jgi:hypothetical protein
MIWLRQLWVFSLILDALFYFWHRRVGLTTVVVEELIRTSSAENHQTLDLLEGNISP